MKHVYNFCGGRKIFMFLLLLWANAHGLYIGKWVPEFGYFCIGLYSVIVLGFQSTKYIRGKEIDAKKE